MKNIFYILLLLPTIIFAQYPSNSGQKITLGEQTTADGLVWRGRLNDTSNLLTNKLDTSVYIVLDTGTRAMWYYRASTTPKWTRLVDSLNNLQGQLSLTTKVTDVLPVANGGTNLTTFTAANRIPYASSATALTTSSNLTYNNSTLVVGNENDNYDNLALKNKAATNNTNRRAGLTANTYEGDSLVGIMSVFAGVSDRSLVFGGGVSNLKNPTDITFFTSTNVENPVDRGSRHRMYINNIGDIGLGTLSPSERLHVVGNGLFIGSVTANSLSLTTPLSVANGGTGQTTSTLALNALLPTQSQSTTIGATLKSNGTNTYWDNFSAAGTVQDQSGNFYNTVAIGTQVWFKENLRTKKYRSGALIPVKTNTDTSTLVGQMYYYSNDSLTNYSVYGALYNWKATQSSDSLCPVGWHVPTDTELTTLTTFLGGSGVAGGKIKSTGTTYWSSPNTGATNETGFSVLPGGIRTSNTGLFILINSITAFWTSTEFPNSNSAYYREIVNSNDDIGRGTDTKSAGFFVRCLKN